MRNKLIIRTDASYLLVCITTIMIFFSITGDRLNRAGLVIAVILTLLNINKKQVRKAMPSLFFSFVVLLALIISGRSGERGFDAPIGHAYKFVHVYLCILISTIVSRYDNSRKRFVIRLAFWTFFITSLISLYYVFRVTPFAIRYSGNLTLVYGQDTAVKSFPLVATFGQCYAVPGMIMALSFLWMRSRTKRKMIVRENIQFYIVFSLFVFLSLLTTSLLLTVFGIVVSYLLYIYYEKNYKTVLVVILGLLLLLLLLIFRNQIAESLYKLTEPLNWQLKERLRYVINTVFRVDYNIGYYTRDDRERLVAYSWNTFKEYPLFGAGYKRFGYGVIGSHQEWGDLFGTFGLVGSITFIAIFIAYCISCFKKLRDDTSRICFIICCAMFIILGFMNPCLSPSVLFTLLVISPNISALCDVRVRLKQPTGVQQK